MHNPKLPNIWTVLLPTVEDEASSKPDKKVKWYNNHHDNLTDDIRLVEERASTEWDHCWNADEKLAQSNSMITELEAKLMSLQRELVHWSIRVTHSISLICNQRQLLADQAGKGRKGKHSLSPCNMGVSSWMRLVRQYWLMSWCQHLHKW